LRALLASLLLLLLAAPAARGWNGPMPTSIGVKGPVTLSAHGDGQSMFRMPSSIAWNLEHRIDLDVFGYQSFTTVENQLNDLEAEAAGFGASGGIVLAPGRPDLDALEVDDEATAQVGRLTLGFGVYPDLAGGGTPDKVRLTTFPESIGVATELQFITGAFVGAFRLTDWLAIGATFHVIWAQVNTRTLVGGSSTPLGGSPRINGVPIPGNPTYSDFLSLFSNDASSDPTTQFRCDFETFQFNAGVSITLMPHERLAIGLSYRERSWAPLPFEGEAKVDATRTFDRALGGLDPALQGLFLGTLPQGGSGGYVSSYDAELEGIHVPRQVRLSVCSWPFDSLFLGAEVAWIEWHDAFDTAKISLEDGSNPDVSFVVGSTQLRSNLVQRWHNRWVFALQAAWQVVDRVTLRLGGSYSESPINFDRLGVGSSSGLVGPHVMGGVGVDLLDDLQLSLLLEWAPKVEVRADQSNESVTFRGSEYSAEQLFFHVGVSLKF
jgi:long-subunit fatty acid transport protein